MTEPIRIDGSTLEGGGQLLRVAVALSAMTGKTVQIDKIRVRREKPGLRPQHLAAVRAVAELVGAKVRGLDVGSQSILFEPAQAVHGDFRVDVGTAGSTTLVLQALMPALAFAPSAARGMLTGGTNNPLAPTIDYMTNVLQPALSQMGYRCNIELRKRGFYPTGGGQVAVSSHPTTSLIPLNLTDSGEIRRVRIISYSCKLPSHITSRLAETASEIIRKEIQTEIITSITSLQADNPLCSSDPGCGLLVTVDYASGIVAGFDGLGERGKPAERIGEEIASAAVSHIKDGAQVEPHLCDQLIVWMSLADGRSEIRTSRLNLHAVTCMEIARQLLNVKFEVEGGLDRPSTVRCKGASLQKPP